MTARSAMQQNLVGLKIQRIVIFSQNIDGAAISNNQTKLLTVIRHLLHKMMAHYLKIV